MEPIILASSSERRQWLLRCVGIPFVALTPDIDESRFDDMSVDKRVVALAREKALAAEGLVKGNNGRYILTADTLVVQDGRSLGKPQDRLAARCMIEDLEGKRHEVYTAIAWLDREAHRLDTRLSISLVDFFPLSTEEVEAYLDSGEWEGVAGAYRIQGKAALFVKELRGSWSSVVGLPLEAFYDILLSTGLSRDALATRNQVSGLGRNFP